MPTWGFHAETNPPSSKNGLVTLGDDNYAAEAQALLECLKANNDTSPMAIYSDGLSVLQMLEKFPTLGIKQRKTLDIAHIYEEIIAIIKAHEYPSYWQGPRAMTESD